MLGNQKVVYIAYTLLFVPETNVGSAKGLLVGRAFHQTRRTIMPVTENLAVQTHQQDTDYYCGAACAQMVMETICAGILDQDDL